MPEVPEPPLEDPAGISPQVLGPQTPREEGGCLLLHSRLGLAPSPTASAPPQRATGRVRTAAGCARVQVWGTARGPQEGGLALVLCWADPAPDGTAHVSAIGNPGDWMCWVPRRGQAARRGPVWDRFAVRCPPRGPQCPPWLRQRRGTALPTDGSSPETQPDGPQLGQVIPLPQSPHLYNGADDTSLPLPGGDSASCLQAAPWGKHPRNTIRSGTTCAWPPLPLLASRFPRG